MNEEEEEEEKSKEETERKIKKKATVAEWNRNKIRKLYKKQRCMVLGQTK